MLKAIKDLFDESGPNLRARLVTIYSVPAVLNVSAWGRHLASHGRRDTLDDLRQQRGSRKQRPIGKQRASGPGLHQFAQVREGHGLGKQEPLDLVAPKLHDQLEIV